MIYYLIAVSACSIVITVYDKLASKAGLFRIPEKTLLAAALLGGAAAMYISMIIIRHKTRKRKFMLTLPILIILQLIAFYLSDLPSALL